MKVGSYNGYLSSNLKLRKRDVTFQRKWAEHVAWGANYKPNRAKADFKLFTFPDAKKVFLEVAKNISATAGGIKSRSKEIIALLMAFSGIASVIAADNKSQLYEMKNNGDGVFNITDINVKKGDAYRFVIKDKDGNYQFVKDPYSKQQSDINGWSEIYDKDNYHWKNTQWFDNTNTKRIKRNPYDKKFHGLENLVIEEINIPTISEKGDFDSAKEYIDGVAERGVANAIEIMPLENTYSLQWGYDGVDKFAVNSRMGGNDEFKSLVDYIHGKGLNVIIDMVPNHMGPDGDYLKVTGPYEKGNGGFGAKFNFEGENSRYVRDFITNAALNWINEYKADGLRLDLTSDCESDLLLKQIAKEINFHNPDVFIIAEHGVNGKGITQYTDTFSFDTHEKVINDIDNEVSSIVNGSWYPHEVDVGFDSKWDFELMHSLVDGLLSDNRPDLNRIENAVKNTGFNIKYLYSHDEIGNLDGTRFVPKSIAQTLNLSAKVKGSNVTEIGQAAARVSQAINDYYIENGSNITETGLNNVARSAGLFSHQRISMQEFLTAYNIAKAKQKLGIGCTFVIPGPKMFFQGDDRLNTKPFKFFRELSSDFYNRASAEYIANTIKEKGYDTLESVARPECVIDDNFSNDNMNKMSDYIYDLSQLSKNTKSLNHGDIVGTYKDFINNVFIMHLKCDNEETLVFMNFGNGFHNNTYSYDAFPSGEWHEILNSDDYKYGGGGYCNDGHLNISNYNQKIALAPNSICILKRHS